MSTLGFYGFTKAAKPHPNQHLAPRVNAPLPIRKGVQMAVLELAEPGVRNLLRPALFSETVATGKQGPLQRLVKAYVAQQNADVRQSLDAVGNM